MPHDIIHVQSDDIGEYLGTPITMAMSKEQMFDVIKGLSATVKELQRQVRPLNVDAQALQRGLS